MTRHTIVLNGRGMTRSQYCKVETVPVNPEHKPNAQNVVGGYIAQSAQYAKGGYSVKNWVPPMKNPLELHAPLANFIGPRTHVRERLMRNIQPTTSADAGARIHDSAFYNIGKAYSQGRITKEQAVQKVRAADNKLIAAAKKAPLGPVETAHKLAVVAGITGKKALENVGLMQGTKFIQMSGDAPDLPAPYDKEGLGKRKRKPKKKDLLRGLEKRFKKL